MKKNCQITRALLLLLASSSSEIMAAPLGTAFTYQGRLAEDGQPANGVYDLRFVIYDAASGGIAVAGPITNSPVAVSNGLFATTLDFGEDVFIGDARWLEVGVRSNGVAADFAALSPRQPLTPAPYALYAPNAGGAAMASLATSAASVAANGVANASLQANAITSDKIADGTIGTADIATIDGGKIVGGDLAAARLKVGDSHTLSGMWATIAGGVLNTAGDYGAAVGGGHLNTASGYLSTISGGANNTASDYYATVGGGYGSLAGGPRATVGGGESNTARGYGSTVGGGYANAATNNHAAVPGGRNNLAGGENSLAAGRRAKAMHDGAFVWADGTDADFASTKSNQFLIRAGGGVGINIASPGAALDVAGGDALVRGPGNFAPGTDARVILGDANNYVRAVWGEGLRLGVWQGADALAVKNGGNVGIGTVNPTTKLEVQGGPIKATGGFIIETRTTDPPVPVTGQMWLRTDL